MPVRETRRFSAREIRNCSANKLLNMKRLSVIILIVSAFFLYFPSCYYDNEEVLYPSLVCDSINVTYDKNISQIMSGYCTSCHSGSQPQAGVSLTTYEEAKANEALIDLAIKHKGKSDMPPGGQLNDCMIRQWDLWLLHEMPQ